MYVTTPEEVRAKLEAARVAIAGQLRRLADEIEALPLHGAAEVVSWLGYLIDQLMREADRILGAQPRRRLPIDNVLVGAVGKSDARDTEQMRDVGDLTFLALLAGVLLRRITQRVLEPFGESHALALTARAALNRRMCSRAVWTGYKASLQPSVLTTAAPRLPSRKRTVRFGSFPSGWAPPSEAESSALLSLTSCFGRL